MSEVEKMYKLAMVTPTEITVCGIDEEIIHYPPFTAEKQLSLIKWLAKRPLTIDNVDGEFEFSTGYKLSDFGNFEESLAELIILYWQDLTEQERTEIREILSE